ncbi:unnamed protein product [Closterium sp. NIES-53]
MQIKFYCQRDSRSGACLLVRAAEEGQVGALHALAAINAHGSGGSAADANPAVAAEVLWHAAVRGSRSALQELGHSYLVRPPLPFRPFRSFPSRRSVLFFLPLSPHVSPIDAFPAAASRGFGSLQEMVYEHEERARAAAGGVHFSREEVGFNRGAAAAAAAAAATAAQPAPSVGGAVGGWFCDAQVSSSVVGAGFTELHAVHGESLHDAARADASSDFGDSGGDLRDSGACGSGYSVAEMAGWEGDCRIDRSGENAMRDCGREGGQGQAEADECVLMPLWGAGAEGCSDRPSTANSSSRGRSRSQQSHESLHIHHSPSHSPSALPPAPLALPQQICMAHTAGMEPSQAATLPSGNSEAVAPTDKPSSPLVSVITCQAGCHLTVSITQNVSPTPVQQVGSISLFSPLERGMFQQEQLPYQVIVPFMREWAALFGLPDGRQMCSNWECSRLETRPQEFRCCVVCERAPDHFLALDPTTLTVDDFEKHLLAAEKNILAVGAARGTPRSPLFEGCSPSPLTPSYASAAAAHDYLGAEGVGAASAPSGKRRSGRGGRGGRGSGGGGGGGGGAGSGGGEVEVVGVVVGVEAVEVVVGAAEALGAVEGATAAVGEEGAVVALVVRASSSRRSSSSSSISVSARPPLPSNFLTGFHTEQRCFARLSDAWRAKFPDAPEFPNWTYLLRRDVPIFDLDYEAILAAMYALFVSAEGDCYLCVPPDPGIAPGIAPAALGACDVIIPLHHLFLLPHSFTSAPLGTAPAQALHTFTLDPGASRCFFRDSTTVTPLPAPVPVSLADPSGGPVLARSSTVLPCPAVPFGELSGLHLP